MGEGLGRGELVTSEHVATRPQQAHAGHPVPWGFGDAPDPRGWIAESSWLGGDDQVSVEETMFVPPAMHQPWTAAIVGLVESCFAQVAA
jgi:hypothetical protein